jgi:hypothetical protein
MRNPQLGIACVSTTMFGHIEVAAHSVIPV